MNFFHYVKWNCQRLSLPQNQRRMSNSEKYLMLDRKKNQKNKRGVGSLKAHFGISPRVCTNDQTQTMLRVECRTEKENQSQQNTDSWLVLRTLTAGLF